METSSPTPTTALQRTWHLSDTLFDHTIRPENALSRPITLRHPYIFYLGHLPAFAWNTIRRLALPSRAPGPVNATFEELFERGIDPDVDSADVSVASWPEWEDVVRYRDEVRAVILSNVTSVDAGVLRMVAEHDAMHVETLQYMIAQAGRRPGAYYHRGDGSKRSYLNRGGTDPDRPDVSWVPISAGEVKIGRDPAERCRDGEQFGWDNEFHNIPQHVAAFQIAKHAVSVRDFLRFVQAGGYERPDLWGADDWAWLVREDMSHPRSWESGPDNTMRILTGVDATATVDETGRGRAANWPASVSLAEARAYARWCRARLCTEAEWVRAGGRDVDMEAEGDLVRKEPVDVDVGIDGDAVCQLGGNGWEVTESVFESFQGFEPMKGYEGYSADFFDGKHFVLRGASWVTLPVCRRWSFRNFFQARYPFVFSKFRLVRDGNGRMD